MCGGGGGLGPRKQCNSDHTAPTGCFFFAYKYIAQVRVPPGADISSTVDGVPWHTAFHNQKFIVLV